MKKKLKLESDLLGVSKPYEFQVGDWFEISILHALTLNQLEKLFMCMMTGTLRIK